MDIIDLAQENMLRTQNALMAAAHEAGHAFERRDIAQPRTHCIDCPDKISEARLAAVPNALRCTDCQASKEASERKRIT